MRIYYNFIRPHTALDGKTPVEIAKISEQQAWESLIKKATKKKLGINYLFIVKNARVIPNSKSPKNFQ